MAMQLQAHHPHDICIFGSEEPNEDFFQSCDGRMTPAWGTFSYKIAYFMHHFFFRMTIDQFFTPTTYVKRIFNACLLNRKPIDQSGALSSASGFHVLFSAKAICDHGSPRYDAVNGLRPKPFRRRRRVSPTWVNVCQARRSRLHPVALIAVQTPVWCVDLDFEPGFPFLPFQKWVGFSCGLSPLFGQVQRDRSE